MNDNYVSYMGWVVWDGWCEMSGVRWVVWSGAPQPFLEVLSIDTATPNIVYTQQAAKPAWQEDTNATFVATPIGTATPNVVYTQQATKPAFQEDITANFSQLLLAQLPPTQFTHSKLPNPHTRKTSPQYVRISYWQGSPEHSLHTASCQTRMAGRHQRNIFAPPLLLAQLPRTQFTHSKLPNPHARKTPTQNFRISCWHSYPEHSLHTARRQTRMAGRHQRNIFAPPLLLARLPPTTFTHSKLSNPHARKTPATTRRAATLSRSSEYCACHTERSRGPAATRRAATLSRSSEYCACHTERSRGPAATRRAATLSRGSEYCACHTERSRGPAATRRAATLSRGCEYCACHTDRSRGPAATRRAATLSRRSEYCACHTDRSRSSEYCACHTERSRGPAATRRAATLSRSSEYCACRTDRSRGPRRPGAPQPFLEALSTAPATQTGAAGQRRPGAPQPFLEALSTAPATQTGAAGQRRPGAPQPFLEALSTAPATQTGAAASGDQARRNPF